MPFSTNRNAPIVSMLRGHCGRLCYAKQTTHTGHPEMPCIHPALPCDLLFAADGKPSKADCTRVYCSAHGFVLTSCSRLQPTNLTAEKARCKQHAQRLNLHHILPRAGDSSGKPKAFSVTVRAALVRTAGSPRHTPGRPTALTRQHVRLRSYSPKSGSNRHFEIS